MFHTNRLAAYLLCVQTGKCSLALVLMSPPLIQYHRQWDSNDIHLFNWHARFHFFPPFEDVLALLAWVLFLHTHTHTRPHTTRLMLLRETHTHMHSLRGLLPQAPSYFKRRNLLSTTCVCTPSTASVNFKGPACIPASSIAEMVQRGGGSRLRPQSTLPLGNNSNKPELKWCFLYLLWRIMMPLLAPSDWVTIYFHLLLAWQLLPGIYQSESTWQTRMIIMICT